MTVGNPTRHIIKFTVPLLIGNIFQVLYNMVDTIIVGRTISVEALAAVGVAGAIMFLIVGFATGFTNGLSIIVAQRFGGKRHGRRPQKRRHGYISLGCRLCGYYRRQRAFGAGVVSVHADAG